MEKVEEPWCPCQEELFEKQYPSRKKSDMAYASGVTLLERVHTSHYYERKRKEFEGIDFSSGPSAPYTRRGTKIIDENFPEASLVCPSCEEEFVEERIVRIK